MGDPEKTDIGSASKTDLEKLLGRVV